MSSATRYTPAEVAERLGIDRNTVYELCDEDKPVLGHYRFGRKILIPEDALVDYEQRAFIKAVSR